MGHQLGERTMNNKSEPIWHKPVWITAIVSLISVFLTIPDVVSNYLSKQQDIELARENTKAVHLDNLESKQDQEFKIVNSTLAQQGSERIFIIRYLAATLDDPDARQWAQSEVNRLENLASRQEELSKVQQKLQSKEKELKGLTNKDTADTITLRHEIDALESALKSKTSEITELRQKAGISNRETEPQLLFIRIDLDWSKDPQAKNIGVRITKDIYFTCTPNDDCISVMPVSVPEKITISNGVVLSSIYVVDIKHSGGPFYDERVVDYGCEIDEEFAICTRRN